MVRIFSFQCLQHIFCSNYKVMMAIFLCVGIASFICIVVCNGDKTYSCSFSMLESGLVDIEKCRGFGRTNPNQYFESIKSNPIRLRIFLEKLPKGAELHNHLGGSSYTENLLKYSQNHPEICLNVTTMNSFVSPSKTCSGSSMTPLSHTLYDPDLYRKVLCSWSLYDYEAPPMFATTKPSKNFFNSFGKDFAIQNVTKGEILAEALNRAANNGLSHVELIIMVTNAKLFRIAKNLQDGPLGNMKNQANLLGIQKAVKELYIGIDGMVKKKDDILNCTSAIRREPGCNISFGFLAAATRVVPYKDVFIQVMTAFMLASQHPKVIGVNLVGPEHNYLALKDYDVHMSYFNFFHDIYPSVKISLHAAELRQGLVTPEELRSGRMLKAITIGRASRIGHGVSVGFEPQIEQLLKIMVQQGIAAEICLTSNALLLDVTGKEHPFQFYRDQGVGVSLNTDDQGVLRSDINKEFIHAVQMYNLSYGDVKHLVRTSLISSFLSGRSLWLHQTGGQLMVAQECKYCFGRQKGYKPCFMSRCQKFLQGNEKARIQADVEERLNNFEFSVQQTSF